jgi:hypothetical protein
MLRHPQTDGIPDARWINRELKVADVASELGCRLGDYDKLHCWHPERHKNGDRSPSVGINRKANQVKCFGCNSMPMSVIDLVMDHRGVSVTEAIRWLDGRFEIPRIPKGKHLSEPDRPRFQVGHEAPMELLVRSGVWARLSPSAQRIFPVLLSLAELVEPRERRRYRVTISYRALMRYSGVRSYNSVSAAVREFREWWLLKSLPVCGTSAPIRPASAYLITPYSDEFQELANAVAREHRAACEAEREFRRQARAERVKQVRASKQPPEPDGT